MPTEEKQTKMNEQKTVIGVNTAVNGSVEGDEDLVVEGRVEGSVAVSRIVVIESAGMVQADVNAQSVVVNGILVGNITAEESVQITEEGRVMGDIRAPRVILADGASFSGNIDMGEFDVEQVVEQDAERAAPSKKEPASKGARFAEKSDGEKASARETTQETQPRSTASSSRARATRSRPSAKSPAYATSARAKKKSAPVPRVRAIGRTKAKKKNV